MGCTSSKTSAKSESTREEFHKPSQKKPSSYEQILATKNGTDHQFITLLCTSNAITKQLMEQESSKQSSPTRHESENNIETINSWELLAGLEDDDDEVEEQSETENSKTLNAIKEQEGEGEKEWRRKLAASEIAALKVPAFEFARTGSLRDWLMPSGSNVSPKFGSCEENVFDPDLVSQLEQAMKDLTVEEEEILNQIVEKWKGNVRF